MDYRSGAAALAARETCISPAVENIAGLWMTESNFVLQSRSERGSISLTGYQAGESLQEKTFDTDTVKAVNEGACASTKQGNIYDQS
jgi:hypothetical protein